MEHLDGKKRKPERPNNGDEDFGELIPGSVDGKVTGDPKEELENLHDEESEAPGAHPDDKNSEK